MGTSPDQVRTEIEATRERPSKQADRLADRTSPGRIVRRRNDRVRGAVSGVRKRVMGTASTTSDKAGPAGRLAPAYVAGRGAGSLPALREGR
ncbi:DUF3618 domain-containing protein [Streptomyces phaeoluteigriseus]|uniref:DUF3618 domain-containing protein n=1 Tax=Streptomyces phaeoluteigriseus TaxID=114686 RepID=A0ABY4ZCD4_9ACTN|nr:DUF3618 domain-containing protein [Streptomyces phaeoluteigriseus]USQ85992.1 DUF3618 domain-containing protein [Streptomyces phaeoluteigriseus]